MKQILVTGWVCLVREGVCTISGGIELPILTSILIGGDWVAHPGTADPVRITIFNSVHRAIKRHSHISKQ